MDKAIVSWEALTLPLLRYVAACKGSARREEAIAWLAERFGAYDSSLNGSFGRQVMSAALALSAAGFVEASTSFRWCVSRSGLEVLNEPPGQIDRAFLKRVLRYNEYWQENTSVRLEVE